MLISSHIFVLQELVRITLDPMLYCKVNWYTVSLSFYHDFSKQLTMFASVKGVNSRPSRKGSTLKGKNLLLQEQILSFKS